MILLILLYLSADRLCVAYSVRCKTFLGGLFVKKFLRYSRKYCNEFNAVFRGTIC
ncbi:Uncharacterized protein APZ42_031260 [Daphnia magna]|uniref:Uncharacterized protein n=1 Tax=Daphnia magna TaxID=35525 RepID=A0A164N045_9CRUS|nr:Uncharacterized protein APZ42_031260 [Daphnia magna]